ncbi:hypothetical protein R1flu_006396 [Riccia fluitans]|uniref:Uncharacterized protein n=1 Tax=Riccia fluitans TaxID=41844 RepID=A0ABD1YYX0_9MARC
MHLAGHEYELQLEKLRKEKDDDREQHNISLEAYKTQKLKDMEYVEERVKGVLEAKEATITQLKLELRHLHQQLLESANSILDDDNSDVASRTAEL